MQIKQIFKKLINLISKLLAFSPLTLRGWAVLGFSLFGIFYLALPGSDLVALILSGSALFLLMLSALLCFFGKYKIKKSLELSSSFKNVETFSKTDVPATLKLEGLKLLPWLSLRVKRIFKFKDIDSPAHTLTGGFKKSPQITLNDSCFFPHRGFWQTEDCKLSLSDRFGLINLNWLAPLISGVEASPPEKMIEPVPTVASSWTAGDQISQTKERLGDPFDIKAYHPSDGTKRILWKVYARRGELVVRQPEPSVLPNGEVLIYLVAGPQDDLTAGCLVNYLKQLKSAEIEVIFGTDGSPEAVSSEQSFEDIFRQINYAAFHEEAGSGSGLKGFLESPLLSKKNFREVIIFAGDSLSKEQIEKMKQVTNQRNINLKLCLSPSLASSEASRTSSKLTGFLKDLAPQKLAALIGLNPKSKASTKTSPSFGQGVHYCKLRKA